MERSRHVIIPTKKLPYLESPYAFKLARDFSAHAGHVVCVHGHRDALAHGGSVHGRRRFIVLRNHLVCASRHLTAIDVTALEAFAGRSKAAATVPVPPAVREVCPGSRKMMELRDHDSLLC